MTAPTAAERIAAMSRGKESVIKTCKSPATGSAGRGGGEGVGGVEFRSFGEEAARKMEDASDFFLGIRRPPTDSGSAFLLIIILWVFGLACCRRSSDVILS